MRNGFVEQKALGTFQIESGEVFMTDPCYDVGTWCMHPQDNVKNGTWHAFTKYEPEEERVCQLVAVHEDHLQEHEKSLFENIGNSLDGHVGVDSGQAGIFDKKYYQDNSVIPADYKFNMEPGEYHEPWYCLNCDTTSGDIYNHNQRVWSKYNRMEFQYRLHRLEAQEDLMNLFPEVQEAVQKYMTKEEFEIRSKKKIDEESLFDPKAGVIPFGVVSSSGYGDGGYEPYGLKDDNGQYIKLSIIFIGDDEDEEEEDDE